MQKRLRPIIHTKQGPNKAADSDCRNSQSKATGKKDDLSKWGKEIRIKNSRSRDLAGCLFSSKVNPGSPTAQGWICGEPGRAAPDKLEALERGREGKRKKKLPIMAGSASATGHCICPKCSATILSRILLCKTYGRVERCDISL